MAACNCQIRGQRDLCQALLIRLIIAHHSINYKTVQGANMGHEVKCKMVLHVSVAARGMHVVNKVQLEVRQQLWEGISRVTLNRMHAHTAQQRKGIHHFKILWIWICCK